MTLDTSKLWDTGLPAEAPPEFRPGNLAAKFVQPPFSVLDTRKGDWQERRRAWLSLGIKSELGRGADLLSLSPAEQARGRWASNPDNAAPGGAGTDLMGPMREKMAARAGAARAFDTGVVVGQGNMVGQMAKGFRSGEGRELVPGKGNARSDFGAYTTDEEQGAKGGTSIFDPVLCELAYRWWAPPGGTILDPFAGGSVRGIVAAKLGHPYTGIDLSAPQLAANAAQADLILDPSEPRPQWLHGDSTTLDNLLPAGTEYDMVWTCPPYFDLEVYSDDPADLSAMEWPGFIDAYQRVIELACGRLRRGRFAAIVVSEVRDPTGSYRGLVPLTIHAFQLAGLRFYNEAVLVNAIGSLPLRATKYMESSRKLGRAHQNVLVFLKGDPPRGWSYDRAAPPDPQLDLHLLADDPAPAPAVPVATATLDELGAPADEVIDALVEGLEPAPVIGLTPVEQHGDVWLKRDDLFEIAGVRGGKVRTCWRLAANAHGLVTAGSRSSPQANIVAQLAQFLGVPAEVHTPQGELSPELVAAQAAGATVVQHQAGYNSVIVARARAAAAEHGWTEIPFGMECAEAVEATAEQVANVPAEAQRLVVPVGSGMSLAGILHGLERAGRQLPVVGVVVGANPTERLDKWAPAGWRQRVVLVPSGSDYSKPAATTSYAGVELDAHYEAKCLPHLEPGDLLWVVGIRATQAASAEAAAAAPAGDTGGASADAPRQRPNLEAMSTTEPAAMADALETYYEVAAEVVAAGDTVDHPDGYVADVTTGEVLEYPPAEPMAFDAEGTLLEPTVAKPAPATEPSRCKHEAGFHSGALEATACSIGGWWPGWPSVIPPGPPGAGAGAAPPPLASAPRNLWDTSDEQQEGPS